MQANPDNRPQLQVVGALHMDEIATVQGPFVPAASNPVVWQRFVGGVGSNAARAAQAVFDLEAYGCPVTLHAALGDDNAGKSILDELQRDGVRVQPQFVTDKTSGRYSVVIDSSGQMILGLADVQIAEHLQPHAILSTVRKTLTTNLLLDANLSHECIRMLLESTGSPQFTVAALTVSPAKAIKLLPWANSIDFLFCNRREAYALALEARLICAQSPVEKVPLQQLADALVELQFNDFVLTDAASPLIIRCEGLFVSMPVPDITITMNVNGAGDTLAGASTAALTMGIPLTQAVRDHGLSLAADVLTGKRLPLRI